MGRRMSERIEKLKGQLDYNQLLVERSWLVTKSYMETEDEDPIMGFTQKYDFIFHFESSDKYIYEVVFYDFPTPMGMQKEFKMLEIIYIRK